MAKPGIPNWPADRDLWVYSIAGRSSCGATPDSDSPDERTHGFIADHEGLTIISGDDDESIVLHSINRSGIASGSRVWAEDDEAGEVVFRREAILANKSEVVTISSQSNGDLLEAVHINDDDAIVANVEISGRIRISILKSKTLDQNGDGKVGSDDFVEFA